METVEQLVSFHHIQVQLSGGAPWGFTLKGGLEHGEPLIITKIEEGGKASQCKKLKVGDELININGSALYGSRQEALILIKGSYRTLKLAVRRRSVPFIRPHSWHLAKLSELPLPPPPPPHLSPPTSIPLLADSPSLPPPPPPPPAMQLHPGSYTLTWHTSDNSDLPMQWSQLSRPYSSTDRSSSLGSMESLDNPTPVTQPYSDSLSSPVDSALFNNKRDSAYSSFSASSNTSDYATVLHRPGDVCSMESFLQSLGPSCPGFTSGDATTLVNSSGEAMDEAQLIRLKSMSLTRPRIRPVEMKERPSSCSYEEERRGGDCDINGESGIEGKMPSTEPPNGKDSFKTTRSFSVSNKRCASAPIEMCSVPCFYNGSKSSPSSEPGTHNGFLQVEEGNTGRLGSCYSQNEQLSCNMAAQKDYSDKTTTDQLADFSGLSVVDLEPSVDAQGDSHVINSQTKHPFAGLHQQNGPKNTPQYKLQYNSDNSSLDPSSQSDSSCSIKSSPLSPGLVGNQDASNNLSLEPPNKYDESRCSTPGSVFLEVDVERMGIQGKSPPLIQHHHPWGRSVSVPEDPTGTSVQGILGSDQILGRDFQPLSVAVSVDTLIEEQRADESKKSGEKSENNATVEATMKKSSRNHRRNRRRSERFATNLRNEIQRKKAQLQSSRGPGGLLSSGETVQEEEGAGIHWEPEEAGIVVKERITKVVFAPTVNAAETVQNEKLNTDDPPTRLPSTTTAIQIVDPGVPNFGVSIRVVEEPAPAGKARRWRWTPKHKLQPEPEPSKLYGLIGESPLGVTQSRHGVCAFTSSSTPSGGRSSSCSRMEESDILPFADRRKFFEETSKSIAESTMSSLSGRTQSKTQEVEDVQYKHQRRYSYQGGLQQEKTLLLNPMEARRPSVCTSRERQQVKKRDQIKEWEERAKEQERDEKLREIEMQQKERQERELQMEREMLREKDREERVRQWEMEREMELELERAKEKEHLKKEREEVLERQRKEFFISSCARERNQNFYDQNMHPTSSSTNQVPRSAFYPVNQASQPSLDPRSYTPKEGQCPARQQETSKLNRKYSLTERDYISQRREQHREAPHQVLWTPRQLDSDRSSYNSHTTAPPPAPLSLRERAMSENDLRFNNNQHWIPWHSSAITQTLSEVKERTPVVQGDVVRSAQLTHSKKKPPPRPPPPKWEQFHRRRVSHHMLFCSSSTAPLQHSSTEPTKHLNGEPSRQRSYSLPPQRQEVAENCPRCICHQPQPPEPTFTHIPSSWHQFPELSIAPLSPMFSRRAFRPVAPPTREWDGNLGGMHFQQHERVITPPQAPESLYLNSLSESDTSLSDLHKPLPSLKPGAVWDRTPSPGIHSNNALPPVLEDGCLRGVLTSYSSSDLDYKQQQPILGLPRPPETRTKSEMTLSPSPSHSIEAELDVPLETDIDDFQEDERLHAEEELITSELPCFALPITVLETDIDTLPDPRAKPVGETSREDSGSVEEELESGREELSLEELFLHCREGEIGTDRRRGTFQSVEHNTDSLDRRSVTSSSCSSYYSTSAGKAQLLSQMKDFSDNKEHEEDDELTYKRQLMESLRKKLGVLREAQRGLQDDIRANAQLGEEVEKMVVAACKPNEVDKFRMFIGDLDKVVSLLLSLSARLLRVETTLDTLDPDTEEDERLPLLEKKRQLMRQLSEAQDLKDHVDQREQAVSRVLAQCFSPDHHRDYSHFVKMKAALLVEQKQLEDKIRLGEEQLKGLRESLGLGLGLGMGMSMGYGHY